MPGPQTQHKGTVYGDDDYLLTDYFSVAAAQPFVFALLPPCDSYSFRVTVRLSQFVWFSVVRTTQNGLWRLQGVGRARAGVGRLRRSK